MLIVPTEKRFDWQHAPLVLFGIVALNILIFFTYQAGDTQKFTQALSNYLESGYLEKEWPAYQDYLKENKQEKLLSKLKPAYESQAFGPVAARVLQDKGFFAYIMHHQRTYFYESFLDSWYPRRMDIQKTLDSLSFNAFGLNAKDFSVFSLLSHQFLHGDLMHLMGNLFFLVICGFAVEAAIGHRLFALFYLSSGVFAGLSHLLLNLDSHTSLVGASGAISGVMAMYLAVFRLQKIEFFYWIFFFVGYFRAPALLILPFWLGKELLQYFTMDNSNVAFMAHAGGFIAGAALIFGAMKLKPDILNQDYIESDQDIDAQKVSLAEIYDLVEQFQFVTALQKLHAHTKLYGNSFDLEVLRYSLLKLTQSPHLEESVLTLLSKHRPAPKELSKLANIWRDNVAITHQLPDKAQVHLANQFCQADNLAIAERIFIAMREKGFKHPSMGVLARKLATNFQQNKEPAKAKTYQNAAEQIIQGHHHGPL